MQEFYNLLIRIQPNVEEEVLSIDDASNTEEEVVLILIRSESKGDFTEKTSILTLKEGGFKQVELRKYRQKVKCFSVLCYARNLI